MKKAIVIGLLVFALIGVLYAQNWHNNTKAGTTVPGLLKFHTPLVIKERVQASDSTTYYSKVGSDSTIRILLGTLPANTFLTGAHCYVETAFNGDAGDSCCVGTATDIDAYVNEFAVSSTGAKTATLLANYPDSVTTFYLFYRKTNSANWPTTGNVVLSLEYIIFPD